jgi:hypothetical protein
MLSPKQSRFVDEYLVDRNGKQAAIRAGYSANSTEVRSDAAASKAPLEVDPRPGSGAVIVIDTSRNAGSEQSVSYL